MIHNGNNIEVLKTFADNSIDAIVTDPPYGLSFMGKKWDYDVPSIELWTECLRVLKPGGHLLAFAGTRTQHRMAVRIEDAGFEIRDMIAWVYGCLSEDTEILTENGWERYNKNILKRPLLCYNIQKGLYEFHKPTKEYFYKNEHPAYRIKSDVTDQIVSRNHRVVIEREGKLILQRAEELESETSVPILESLRDLPNTIHNVHTGTSIKKSDLLKRVQKQDNVKKSKKRNKAFATNTLSNVWSGVHNKDKKTREILFPQMFRQSQRLVAKVCEQRQGEKATRKRIGGSEKPSLERGRNILQKARELLTNKVYTMSERIYCNGKERRVCYGASVNNGSAFRQGIIKDRSNTSYKPQPTGQPNRELNVIRDQQGTQTIRRTRAKVTKIEYNGNVWCVEVPTGVFVARRNGQIFITGNSGFPKSLNIGKAVDKLQGNEREQTGLNPNHRIRNNNLKELLTLHNPETSKGTSKYEGLGTALKPALEPITLARKPISEKSIAENVLKWGTGGINIDGCRVDTIPDKASWYADRKTSKTFHGGLVNNEMKNNAYKENQGRFPANLIHDGSDEVLELFPMTSKGARPKGVFNKNGNVYGQYDFVVNNERIETDSGSAARFFYCAKASSSERNRGLEGFEEKQIERIGQLPDGFVSSYGNVRNTPKPTRNNHPTVKPIRLMQYLVRLITPPNGLVLDPFMGSGTTGIACKLEGFEFIGIELDTDYCKIAEARIQSYNRPQ